MANRGSVVIEAALNGPWSRRQPKNPLSHKQIVADAVACADAGASMIHFHCYDELSGEQTTDYDVVSDLMDEIRSRTDAVVYPAIRYMTNQESIGRDSGARRYAHLERLATERKLEWLIIDPGSMNLISYDELREGGDGTVDINTNRALNWAFDLAVRRGLHPGLAVYEPGFLRLASAMLRARVGVPTPMYRLVFSDEMTFGFRPREYALQAYLSLLAEEAPGAPWMVAGLRVDVRHLIPSVVEFGGHLRVGLEDAHLGTSASNVDLVDDAVARVLDSGGSVATVEQLRQDVLKQGA